MRSFDVFFDLRLNKRLSKPSRRQVRNEIIYPFLKFNGFHPTVHNWCNHLSMLWLKLTHWGRVTHICVGNLTIIGSDNDLSPGRRQAIIWTNAGILLIGPLGIEFSEIFIEIIAFSFKEMRLKVSSAKRRPFWFGLNVLIRVSKKGPCSICCYCGSFPISQRWYWPHIFRSNSKCAK